jgi:hypothetical protein
MHLFGWNYTVFLPIALALAACALLWKPSYFQPSVRRAAVIGLALWALSSVIVLLLSRTTAPNTFNTVFVVQRDAGYLLGGAVALLLPFLAAATVYYALAKRGISRNLTVCITICAGVIEFLAVPPVFFAGSVFGCAILGYSTCM